MLRKLISNQTLAITLLAGSTIGAAAAPQPKACVALFGMITYAGELGEHRPVAEAGDEPACRAVLEEAGLAAGLDNPQCGALLWDIEQKGVPQELMREAGQVYRGALMADDPDECAEALQELRAQRGH